MRFIPAIDGLEPRISLSAIPTQTVQLSDPTIPRPPANPPVDPEPTPEPDPGPFPGPDPPIIYPPPPVGGPVGPA